MYATEQKNAYFGQILTKIRSAEKVLKNARKQNGQNAITLSLFTLKCAYCFSRLFERGYLSNKCVLVHYWGSRETKAEVSHK